jgi:hypothetical protein
MDFYPDQEKNILVSQSLYDDGKFFIYRQIFFYSSHIFSAESSFFKKTKLEKKNFRRLVFLVGFAALWSLIQNKEIEIPSKPRICQPPRICKPASICKPPRRSRLKFRRRVVENRIHTYLGQ